MCVSSLPEAQGVQAIAAAIGATQKREPDPKKTKLADEKGASTCASSSGKSEVKEKKEVKHQRIITAFC